MRIITPFTENLCRRQSTVIRIGGHENRATIAKRLGRGCRPVGKKEVIIQGEEIKTLYCNLIRAEGLENLLNGMKAEYKSETKVMQCSQKKGGVGKVNRLGYPDENKCILLFGQ